MNNKERDIKGLFWLLHEAESRRTDDLRKVESELDAIQLQLDAGELEHPNLEEDVNFRPHEVYRLLVEVERGDAVARHELALRLLRGDGVLTDYRRAARLFLESAKETSCENARRESENGYAATANQLGIEYACDTKKTMQDSIKAFRLFWIAAAKGDVAAKWNLARCYSTGFGTEQDDGVAFRIYCELACCGENPARNIVGVYLMDGRGSRRDVTQGVWWFRVLADNGFWHGLYNLGVCYFRGLGVEADRESAIQLFLKAGKKGHWMAKYALVKCFKYGQGVQKNVERAEHLLAEVRRFMSGLELEDIKDDEDFQFDDGFAISDADSDSPFGEFRSSRVADSPHLFQRAMP